MRLNAPNEEARRYMAGMVWRQLCRGMSRATELEPEARQTRFEARQRLVHRVKKNPPSPRCIAIQNLISLNQTVWLRVNGFMAPPSWFEVISMSFICTGLFTRFKLDLDLRGRTLSLSWLITTEPKQSATFQTEPRPRQNCKTVWCRGEAERRKKAAARPPRAEADASRTPSLTFGIQF